jgi:endonuclease/exonuclease/phosphatase family metal-dependent hydrolase
MLGYPFHIEPPRLYRITLATSHWKNMSLLEYMDYCREKYLNYRPQYSGARELIDKAKYKKYKAKYKKWCQGGGNSSSLTTNLTVVTYNIAKLAKGNTQANTIDNVVEILKGCHADVICLQEVGVTASQNQAELVANELGMNYHFEQACLQMETRGFAYTHSGITMKHGTEYGNAILVSRQLKMRPIEPVRMSRGSLMKNNGERMSGADEGRVAAAVIISCGIDPRVKIICISTHLGKHNSYDIDNGSSLIPVSKIAEAFSTPDSLPSILAGDLNVTPTSPTISYLSEQGWLLLPSADTRTDEKIKIDYVMPRNSNGVELQPVGDQVVIYNQETLNASDHLPLMARFRVIRNKNHHK